MKLIEKVKVFYRRNEFTYILCYPLRIAYNLFSFI